MLAEVEAEIGQPLDWSKLVFVITPRPEVAELADVGEAITNYWREVGADIKIQVMEFATFREHILPGTLGGVAWTDGTIRFEDPRMLEIVYYSGRDPGGWGSMLPLLRTGNYRRYFREISPSNGF